MYVCMIYVLYVCMCIVTLVCFVKQWLGDKDKSHSMTIKYILSYSSFCYCNKSDIDNIFMWMNNKKHFRKVHNESNPFPKNNDYDYERIIFKVLLCLKWMFYLNLCTMSKVWFPLLHSKNKMLWLNNNI